MQHNIQSRQPLTWQDIWNNWLPTPKPFKSNHNWEAALRYLKLPVDPVHLGEVKGDLGFPISQYNLYSIPNMQKAHTLILMIHELKPRSIIVKDMFGEIECAVSESVLKEHTLTEGTVIIVENATILPGPVLNLTGYNITAVFL